jgi:hypothetical protein
MPVPYESEHSRRNISKKWSQSQQRIDKSLI